MVVPGISPFGEYSEEYIKIIDKRGRLVPFKLNAAQVRVEKEIAKAKLEGRPVRLIILKARQLGFSTWSLARMYEYSTTRMYVQSFFAAHDDDATSTLFGKVKLMHDMAPKRPMIRYSNRRELDFANPKRNQAHVEPGLMSLIRVGTAGKTTLGRGSTLRFLHCSEVAFWKNAGTVLLGLEQALPDEDPDTIEIIESTANGMGGEFHDRWKMASNERTRGDWRAIFFPWYEEPKYSRDLHGGELTAIPSCIEDKKAFLREELEIKGLHDLTDRQINWRRWAIVNRCGNKMDNFRQEYPTTPEEAFLTSGRPVFNRERLQRLKRALEARDLKIKVAGTRNRLVQGDVKKVNNVAKFVPNADGYLRVYEWPKSGRSYAIGADIAEGVTVGKDSDESTAHIIDVESWRQVAVWQGRVPATEFDQILEILGYFYGTAYLIPESNNHGHTVCSNLMKRHYPKLHIREDLDRLGGVVTTRPGWETNTKTRALVVDSIDQGVNDNLIELNDIPTIDQLLTFVRHPNSGKAQGDEGCHDDLVMGLGIVLAVLSWGVRKHRGYHPKKKGPDMTHEQQMVARFTERMKGEWRENHMV